MRHFRSALFIGDSRVSRYRLKTAGGMPSLKTKIMLNIPDLLFGFFSVVTILCSFVTVTSPSPVHAVLTLVGSFAGAGSLLFLFGAEYIAIIFFILYIGAISIVFLFVIMMLDIKKAELSEKLKDRFARYFPVGAILTFTVLGFFVYIFEITIFQNKRI